MLKSKKKQKGDQLSSNEKTILEFAKAAMKEGKKSKVRIVGIKKA
ncbi:hypothetical protein [Viridibacillus arvi]